MTIFAQLQSHWHKRYRAWAKRMMNRAERRRLKRDWDASTRRVFTGYWS